MNKFKFNSVKGRIAALILCSFVFALIASLQICGVDILESLGFAPTMMYGISMATIGNLEGTSDRDSSGAQICMKVYLIHRSQLDPSSTFPLPNASGEVGTIPLKAGEKMYYFTAINDSQEDKTTGTKGDVTTEVVNSFMFITGGNKQKAIEFMENFAGEGFIILYQMADSRDWHILGTDLKPMFLQSFERLNNKSQRSVTFTFQNSSFQQVKKYTGTITVAAATQLAADAATIAFSSSDNYVTSAANTEAATIATFSGLTANDVGRFITIAGGGGTYPTGISATSSIILKDDEDWDGTSGSSITLKVFDTATLVEVSRVQRS